MAEKNSNTPQAFQGQENRRAPAVAPTFQFDDYAPAQIAQRIEAVGVKKVAMALTPMFALSVLAGAFIAFGAMFFIVVMTQNGLGYGPARLLGGVVFSLGLILVLVGGAELFTGNSLIVMGWANGKVTSRALMRNWAVVYVGNFVGALGMAMLAALAGYADMASGAVGALAVSIARAKVELPFLEAFVRGILCNILVCLAVWLCFSAHSVSSKILAIVFPISAFVALGFEHSIANMFFVPFGVLAALHAHLNLAALGLSLGGFVHNLAAVTLGNIVGGGGFVALAYYVIYLRTPGKDKKPETT